ncbi:MAG: RNA polymerase sigma factor [Chloroflexota bacterium]|nr:RNA polymerase sigma factor [Chloroflexota bacterium]
MKLEVVLPAERARLVRLCARLTGNVDAAEDLAQETLIAAWRQADTLRDPLAGQQWLSGIARNLCRRWVDQQRRSLQARSLPDDQDEPSGWSGSSPLTADIDIEIDLERDELATLLDRALALLPPGSRDVLIQRFVEERTHAEIAEHLGVSEGAVALRIHRGKLALRRCLAQPELHAAAASFGLASPHTDEWQTTRVWCPFCGSATLRVRINEETGVLSCRCAGECIPGGTIIGAKSMVPRSTALTSAKSILRRELLDLDRCYRRVFAAQGSQCPRCGYRVPLTQKKPEGPSQHPGYTHGIHLLCRSCGVDNGASLLHLTLDMPAAQQFWRRHPRMRAVAVREVEADGRPALLGGFISLDTHARLDVLLARDTYATLRVDGAAE